MFIRMCMDLFNIGVEVWVGYWLFDVPEHRRFKRSWVRVLEYILFLCLIGVVTLFNRTVFVRFSNLITILQIMIFFISAIIFTKRGIIRSLTWSGIYYMSLSVLEMPGLILSGWITGEPYLKCNTEPIIYDYIYLDVLSILLLAFICLYGKAIRLKLESILCGKMNILWILFAVIEWWIITYFLSIGFKETGSGVFFYNLLFVFCSLLLMIVVIVLTVYRQYEKEIHLRKLHDAMMDVEYEKIKAEYNKNSKEMHDLKHQINTLNSYLSEEQYDAAKMFLCEMSGEIGFIGNRIHAWSNCPLIDMMLDSKQKKATEYGILMDIDVCPVKNPLTERDMSILLGNILDNAIEASIKVEKKRRRINVKIFLKGKIFGISVENSSTQRPVTQNGRLLSTKDNNVNHGWGIVSVQSIVNKYNGQMETRYDEQSFRIDITFFSKNIDMR